MVKSQKNLAVLSSFFVTALLVSNVVAARLVKTGIVVAGEEIILPGAVFCYAITFLITDVIGEIWGREEADRVVWLGMVSQILATALIAFTGWLPTFGPLHEAYSTILGQNSVFVLSSLAAYWVSQNADVWIFHQLKSETCGRKKWLRNNASTITSQFLDTVIFITAAFGFGYGWIFDPAMHGALALMLAAQYGLKIILAVLDTPFFYFLTRRK